MNHDMSAKTANKHEGHSTGMFLRKFWVCLGLTIIVLIYFKFSRNQWVPAVLGSVVFFYGGWIFLKGAGRELANKLPGMMTLISVAIISAYAWSAYAIFAGQEPLFWELTTLISIMLLGHWLEMRAVSGAQGALKELSKLLPDTAEIIRNGVASVAQISDLKENDIVLVKPGSKIPADGVVVEGESDVNESMITGESVPVAKKAGDKIIAGSINGDGALKAKVVNVGEKTFLSGVMRLVREAEASKSRIQMLSDKAAFYLTVVAIASGFITLALWLFFGAKIDFAVARMVAVLVVACPHALGLAIPLVASISTTKAAKNGFLVKQRLALESARSIDTVLFDKTGTLTKGEFGVAQIWGDVLYQAASLDALSEHPIARAIVKEAEERGIKLGQARDFVAIKGKGAKGNLDGKEIMAGGPALAEEFGIKVPEEFLDIARETGGKGQTLIFVFENNNFLGAIALADIIRKESRQAIDQLKSFGIKPAMITGDSEEVAKWVSRELGIEQYFARVLPGEKSEKVKYLQNQGLKIAMVGDGINDAPALAQSDVGIAVGAGTNVAIESAGIILARNDPRDIVKIIKLSKMTYSKMIQNLFWAAGYNVVALPLAAGVLAFKGFMLDPAWAAALMSLSTIIVAINAVLLRGKKL